MEGVGGVTESEVRTALVTVNVVVLLTAPSVAVMTDVPMVSVEARPFASMVATAVVAEVQVAPVAGPVLLSEYVMVAWN
jgi:hypothetical protein